MARADPAGDERVDEGRRDIGEQLHEDTKIRQAQGNPPSDAVNVNLTQFGRERFGIEPGDCLVVSVHEDGIVIRPFESSTE